MTSISERIPIPGEEEPVKCHFCNKWATNRGRVTAVPLCFDCMLIYTMGFDAGNMKASVMYMDRHPEERIPEYEQMKEYVREGEELAGDTLYLQS